MPIVFSELPAKYHAAMLSWQQRHFKDYPYLLEHWSRYYRQDPFRLAAKMGDLKSPDIGVGRFAGRRRFQKAGELDEETRDRVRKIIRAQASTELGSVQQHRESLHKAQDGRLQFDVLRVMAEELRHAYQMVWLLASDTWSGGSEDVAMDAIEELLAMETGGHVLDAFNVYFDSFVDNIVFAALIDRVGKYQLSMQQVFAYAPMAGSMSPMLSEEAFHLVTGVGPMKEWAAQAARGEGNVSIANLQRHVNKWLPRGLEMFGDERGGKTNVELSLKSMDNDEASARYHEEVGREVIDVLNAVVVRSRSPEMPKEEAAALAKRVLATGQPELGLRPEELFYLPARSFFRRRGVHAFAKSDVHGRPLASLDEFIRHLRSVLPEAYVTGKDFSTYLEHLRKANGGEKVEEAALPFFG